MNNLDFNAECEKARQSLLEGNNREALKVIRHLLSYGNQLQDREQWHQGFSLLAEVSRSMVGEALAARALAVAKDSDNVEALYLLGYDLVEARLGGVAATVMERANQLAPHRSRLLLELVAALDQTMQYREAASWLSRSPELVETNFNCRYFLAFNAMMSGDLATPHQLLPGLQQKASSEMQHFMANTIEGMLARAEAVQEATSLNQEDLRGWHFVITGSILLHRSPYGEEVMHGRYAFIQDSASLQREALLRLKAVLETWEIQLPRIFLLPERESSILAHAASRILGCPLESWPSTGGGTTLPGLIVTYGLDRLQPELLDTFFEHRPDQLLWTHTSCWTEYQDFTGDLVSYLHQFNHSPWQAGRLRARSGTQKLEEAPAVEAPVEELAQQIVNSPLEDSALEDLPALLTLAKAARNVPGTHAAGAFIASGKRHRQWPGSPVPSNRFE